VLENIPGNNAGGGILVGTYNAVSGSAPNLNLQPTSITMTNSGGGVPFSIDLNGVVTALGGINCQTAGIQCGGVNPVLLTVYAMGAAPVSIQPHVQYYGQSGRVTIGSVTLAFAGGMLVGVT
jgi:hypothetical protein